MDIHLVITGQTYAEKADRLLTRYRYPHRMQKTVTAEGCVWRFGISGPLDEVLALLQANGIPARLERS